MARCIQDVGAEPFIDAYDIAGGDAFEAEIRTALAACKELVALLTPFALDRAWVDQEVGAMWLQKKRVSAVLHGISRSDLASGATSGIGLLSNRDVIELNDFDTYLSDLRKRCSHDA